MAAKNWVHPKDRGAGKSVTELPDSIRGMTDDSYRSLVGYVEDEGGFKKSSAPFAEFRWADFFRTRISSDLIGQNMHKAVKKTLKLARSQVACGLPGIDEDICD
jgi:hypothetical protein